jgi:cytoskeletal protein RodZ
VKRPFGIGAPKHRRIAMQFGYDVRPSFWQELKANSHLVIAAVGTAALIGIAGTAFWLALPSSERQAFAEPKPRVQTEDPAPSVEMAARETASVVASRVATKADAVRTEAPVEEDMAALARNDPRWAGQVKPAAAATQTSAGSKADSDTTRTAFAEETAGPGVPPVVDEKLAESVRADSADLANASSEDSASDSEPDAKTATAAIPAVQPKQPASEAEVADNGRILRSVTMRTGPKKGAAAIGTIPAKAAVQVIGCKSWCEVIYKGKRGFIYKSFVQH